VQFGSERDREGGAWEEGGYDAHDDEELWGRMQEMLGATWNIRRVRPRRLPALALATWAPLHLLSAPARVHTSCAPAPPFASCTLHLQPAPHPDPLHLVLCPHDRWPS